MQKALSVVTGSKSGVEAPLGKKTDPKAWRKHAHDTATDGFMPFDKFESLRQTVWQQN